MGQSNGEKIFGFNLPTFIGTVMDNIEQFVIPENIDAIEYLWSLNILTVMTNDYENDTSWIVIGKLSKENETVALKYLNDALGKSKNLPCFGYVYGNNGIGFEIAIKPGEKDTFEDFKKIIDAVLTFQDVQEDGYTTFEEFIISRTDYWKIVKNPHYENPYEGQLEKIPPTEYDFEGEKKVGLNASEWFEKMSKENFSTRRIRIPDIKRMVEDGVTIQDVLEEHGLTELCDMEEGKIFHHPKIYEGHMKYKRSKTQKKQ